MTTANAVLKVAWLAWPPVLLLPLVAPSGSRIAGGPGRALCALRRVGTVGRGTTGGMGGGRLLRVARGWGSVGVGGEGAFVPKAICM